MRRAAVLPIVLLLSLGCESLIVPSESLKEEFLAWEFGLFVHFGMGTFTERDWANGYEDPASFAPTRLDMEQWADAAQSAGMKYAVLTTKHTGGWNLWDSELTDHDASAFVNYREGQGDLVAEFVQVFRGRGMKVGLYYVLAGDYDNRFGNQLPPGRPSLHGFPPEAEGDFESFAKGQLTELLTQYGPIDLVWVDQSRSAYTSKGSWGRIRSHIKALQPGAFVIANDSRRSPATDIHSYEYPLHRDPVLGLPPVDNRHPAEISDYLGPSWFWNSTHDRTPLRSAEEIVAMLELAGSRRANYLLNVPPDTTGLFPEAAVQRLREVGALKKGVE